MISHKKSPFQWNFSCVLHDFQKSWEIHHNIADVWITNCKGCLYTVGGVCALLLYATLGGSKINQILYISPGGANTGTGHNKWYTGAGE